MSVLAAAGCTGSTAVSAGEPTTAPQGTSAADDPGAVLDRAMRSLSRSGSVRFDFRYAEQGHHLRNTTYAAADRGWQSIRIDDLHAWVRVVGDRTFARGDRVTLTGYFNLPDTTAQRIANRWYELLDGDPGFDQVTSGVKLSSLIDTVRGLLPLEPLHLVKPTVRNGVRVTGIRGAMPDTAEGSDATVTLWVSRDGRGLPVEIDLDDYASHVHVVAGFDHWGDPVRVLPPAGAVRLAKLPPLTVDS